MSTSRTKVAAKQAIIEAIESISDANVREFAAEREALSRFSESVDRLLAEVRLLKDTEGSFRSRLKSLET